MIDEFFEKLQGIHCMADYKTQIIPQNQGNPFIEALPDRVSVEQLIDRISSDPPVLPEYKSLSIEDRLEFVQQIKPHFWLANPAHYDKYRTIYSMIKIGYQSRNPLHALFNKQFAIGVDNIFQAGINENGANLIGVVQTAQSLVEIAISGWGKTQVYERIMKNLFPQVIHHSEYKGRKLPETQIVWLKVECPYNKSVGAFCKNIYAEIDKLLGTNYNEKFGDKPGKIDDLVRRLVKVVAKVNLGVLIIDEIQKVEKAYSGGKDNMIDFITELVNTIGIPVVLIGSYKALYLFKDSLANTRRGIPDSYMENISGYMDERGWDWNHFIENLWTLQYTKKYTKLTDNLRKTMYSNTLGIPDLVVKLFVHVQSRAIVNGGDEIITVSLINEVADKSLRLAKPLFKRMLSGDLEAFAKLDDVKPDWVALNGYIREAQHRVQIYGNLEGEHSRALQQTNKYEILKGLTEFVHKLAIPITLAESIANQVYEASNGMGDIGDMYTQAAQMALSERDASISIPNSDGLDNTNDSVVLPKSKKDKKIKPLLEDSDIRYIVNEGERQGLTTEESLTGAGLIRDINYLFIAIS